MAVGFLWLAVFIASFCSPERCGARPVRLYENHVPVETSLLTEGESEAYDQLMCDLQQTYWIPARPTIIGERVVIRGAGAYRWSRQKVGCALAAPHAEGKRLRVWKSVQYAIV